MKKKFALISTLIASIATSICIYSHYLFINETIITLAIFLLLFFILRRLEKKSANNYFIYFSLFFLLFSLSDIFLFIPFFFLFSYFLLKNKVIKSIRFYLVAWIMTIFIMYLFFNSILVFYHKAIQYFDTQTVAILGFPVFKLYPNYIPALDYFTYGFYSGNTSVRTTSYISYSFKEEPGNAIFLNFYGLFFLLFGDRGFIYNSPFLIFSIFGILLYKDKRKSLLLSILVLIILIYGLFLTSHGGVLPRYGRFFDVPILILTFFSFYYIQNEKRLWINLIFAFLVVLSILNVTCLAIRADWLYEHEVDLVSYDFCLWPYIPVTKQETNIIEYNLMSKAEQLKWVRSGEGNCRAQITDEGLMTDVCECKYDSWAERDIIFPGSLNLSVNACTHYAGGDGVKAKIYLDNEVIEEFFIPSNSCVTKTIPINTTETSHVIKLYSTINGTCETEMVIWKSIRLS
jgi:hypothetical protein